MSIYPARQVFDGSSSKFQNIPASGMDAVTQSTLMGQWVPADYGFISWAYDPTQVFQGLALGSNGSLYTVALKVPYATTVTNIIAYLSTAGSGLTASQNFACLYQNGTLLGSTTAGVVDSAWAGSVGLLTMPLSSPVAVAAGIIYVGFISNATTRPSFGMGAGSTNFSLTVPRWGFFGGSYTTAPPSTMPAVISKTWNLWAAVN